MRGVVDCITADDPNFPDYLNAAVVGASGVTAERFAEAEALTMWDGYYGPVDDPDEYAECHGIEPLTRADALTILRAGIEGVDDHQTAVYTPYEDAPEDDPDQWTWETDATADAIRRDRFSYLLEIYGSL